LNNSNWIWSGMENDTLITGHFLKKRSCILKVIVGFFLGKDGGPKCVIGPVIMDEVTTRWNHVDGSRLVALRHCRSWAGHKYTYR
jgi:hypothetical protein